jgi:Uma2 family endonuclease
MESWLPRHRITVDEYYRMAEVGLLAEGARVELIEGEIIDMAPIGSRHAAAVARLDQLLQRAVAGNALVRVQLPIRLSRSSEPQPDLVLVRARDDYYASGHPTATDALLVIEISDTTFRYDSTVKLPLYAHHGVPEVWIVDLQGASLHMFRSLAEGRFAHESSVTALGLTPIAAMPGTLIDLTGLLAG